MTHRCETVVIDLNVVLLVTYWVINGAVSQRFTRAVLTRV